MPWNDNSNPGSGSTGPWGSPPPTGPGGSGGPDKPGPGGDRPPPPKSPWGSGPSGGGPRPQGGGPRRPGRPPTSGPDLNELNRRLNEFARRTFGGPGGKGVSPRAIGLAAGAVGLLWLLSGVYAVQGNEQAVVTRTGAYVRTKGPGLGYHLPAPIERVEKVRVEDLRRLNIGGVSAAGDDVSSQMLTGDENIVDLDFTVLWNIRDAGAYLFNVAEQEAMIQMVAESAMREVVGRTALDPIISTGRGQVQLQTQALMQSVLDRYGSGVRVVEVQIRNANPPREVIESFRQVASAGQERESLINEANTYRNRVVNEAKGDASRIRQASEGYRERVTREAEGSAARFNQVYTQYQSAPAVTRDRLYLETMERVLRQSNKVIVDGNGATAPIILPPDLFRNQSRPQASQVPDGASGSAQSAPASTTQAQEPGR